MDPRPDHYDILGVEKDASPEAIRAAFVRASKAAHPDHGGTNALSS